MSKQLLLSLLILGVFTLLPSCNDPEYNQDYEQGYEKGYSIGYSEGYDEGYYAGEEDGIEVTIENIQYCPSDYIDMYEFMYTYLDSEEGKDFFESYLEDCDIITLDNIKSELSENDYQILANILSEYYGKESLLLNE